MSEQALLFIPLGLLAFGVMARYWRQTTLFVMLLMVFEGAARKWWLPQFHSQIYFVKDLCLAAALIGFFATQRLNGSHERLTTHFKLALFACMLYCGLQVFNPNNPSILLWLVGMKSYFLYAALMFMVPYIFTSIADFDRKFRIYMLLMIPVALLGVVQYAAPADHWLNAQLSHSVDSEMTAARFGENDGFVRASSTFSYLGSYATFLPAMYGLALAWVLTSSSRVQDNLVSIGLLAACVLALPTSGSRTVIVSVAMISGIALILSLREQMISAKMFVRVMGGGFVAVLAILLLGTDAVDALMYRSANADSNVDRFLSPFVEFVNAFETSPVFGLGLGTTHNSSTVLMRDPTQSWLGGNLFELETARTVQEVGLLGFVLVYALRIALIVAAINMMRRLSIPRFKALCAVIAGHSLVLLFLYVINNPTGGLYFWFSAGLLYTMYRIEQLELLGRSSPIIQARSPFGPAPHAVWRRR